MRHANFGIFDTVHSLRYKKSKVQNFRNLWSHLHHLPHCKHFYIPCTNRLDGGCSAYHASTHTPLRTESQLTEVMTSCGYSLVSPEGDNHWFKDWCEQRQHKLTASTFAAATGFWRGRRTQLWLEKIGAIRPFMGNAATQWSNAHEKAALERYMWISGHNIFLPGFQEFSASSPDEDWLAASADGIVEHFIYGLPYDGILEIKCPFFAGELTNSYPWSKVPVHYVPQAQGLMEILDKQWMDFYCWTTNGSSLFRMHRCPLYWSLLKSALSDFWWNHVQPAREICSMYPVVDPIWELSPLRPAPKHEQFGDIVYVSKLLADDSKLLLKEINGKIVD